MTEYSTTPWLLRARLPRLGFGVVAFFDQIYRLKDRKKRWFSRWSACEIPPFSFFVRFSFNGCRLTIAVCRYKMQASQISCAGAYRQYGTNQARLQNCAVFYRQKSTYRWKKAFIFKDFQAFPYAKYALYTLLVQAFFSFYTPYQNLPMQKISINIY